MTQKNKPGCGIFTYSKNKDYEKVDLWFDAYTPGIIYGTLCPEK